MSNPAARAALICYHKNKGKLARARKKAGIASPVLEYKRTELMASGDVRPGKWADWGHRGYVRNGLHVGDYHL